MSTAPELARYEWFDPWRAARGPALQALVTSVVEAVEAAEAAFGQRQRSRRQADHERHKTVVEVVVANLAHAVILPPKEGRLAILTGNNGLRIPRYTSPATGKALRRVVDHLWELGVLDLRTSFTRGEASSISPSPAFARAVLDAGVMLSDFGRLPGEEVIVLRGELDEEDDHGNEDRVPKVLLDYPDTATSAQDRATVRSLNTFLDGADLTCLDDGRGPVDTHHRTLKRYFVQDRPGSTALTRGGRLFGPFWQTLPKTRRHLLRLGGEECALVDFSSMFLRLVYAMSGRDAPIGDLYAIPGLEPYRPSVKCITNAMLFDTKPRRSWPKKAKEPQPPEWTVGSIRNALVHRHPVLSSAFGTGVGFELMYQESRLLMSVLEELRSRGFVALALHDGVLVPRSRAPEVAEVMESIALDITGHHFPVSTVNLYTPSMHIQDR